ncbi:MAG: prepilin-type cleavage/methylation domain-containing protein, partial [Planctomycetes bacterium]|nr:prepilin-type cleavage/methylation domain-containing protein [Planctomycetota bacterium]
MIRRRRSRTLNPLTMVELLVVSAILAIFVALLVPSLSKS